MLAISTAQICNRILTSFEPFINSLTFKSGSVATPIKYIKSNTSYQYQQQDQQTSNINHDNMNKILLEKHHKVFTDVKIVPEVSDSNINSKKNNTINVIYHNEVLYYKCNTVDLLDSENKSSGDILQYRLSLI